MPVSSTANICLAYLLQEKAALLWKDALDKIVRNLLTVGG